MLEKINLEWTAVHEQDEYPYNHCVSVTPFGRFLLKWDFSKPGTDSPVLIGFDETPWGEPWYEDWHSVYDAKKAAEAEMLNRINSIANVKQDAGNEIWRDIAHAPIGKKMFVAIAVVMNRTGSYTTDPYCVWQPETGVFIRWPHEFNPTHFMKLPEIGGL